MKYISKIDGCRAFAVLAVLCSHYLPEHYITHQLPLGIWGVQLFFVLSGYLITTILLHSRESVTPEKTKFTQLRIFYVRRVLRIFPAYYALLVVHLLLGIKYENGSLLTCLLYVFNIHQSIIPSTYDYLGHLWTLCIEEQFYLIWPWLMLFIPTKKLVPVAVALIFFAPISRFILTGFDLPYISIRNLPTSQLDSLCGGAFIALIQLQYAPTLKKWWENYASKLAFAGCLMTIIAVSFQLSPYIENVIALLGPALVSMYIVDKISQNHFSNLTSFLDWSPLRYIGKISYGIYLFQFISLFPLYKLITMIGNPTWISQPIVFAIVWTLITVTISSLSWKLFEYPICSLKRFFHYRK